jgi:hypothetical protein
MAYGGPMARKQPDESYSDEETALRVAAALRGARVVGHKSMKEISPKRSSGRTKKRAAKKKR